MRKQWLRVTACALAASFIAAVIAVPLASVEASASSQQGGFVPSKELPFRRLQSWIKKCQEINPEVIGWLTIPGTSINEPITFSDKSNEHYVKRDWRGTNYPDLVFSNWAARPATATYLDSRTKIGEGWKKGSSRNFVLYGHNWNNLRDPLVIGPGRGPDGNPLTMFAELPSYTNLEFAKTNPHIYFSTGEFEGIWRVFSVTYTEVNPRFNYATPFNVSAGFSNIIKEWQARSMHTFDVEVNNTDRLLTLSTCTRQYNVGEWQRFVVVARLLRDGESEADNVKVTANPDWKRPIFR